MQFSSFADAQNYYFNHIDDFNQNLQPIISNIDSHLQILANEIALLGNLCHIDATPDQENIKITKYLEFEKPLVDAHGSSVSRIAIRNAFLIERVDKTVEYKAISDRYYQNLSSISGSCSQECFDAIKAILQGIYNIIAEIWSFVKDCCILINNKLDALYGMITNLEHNNLHDIQGGATDEYYHLDKPLYDNLTGVSGYSGYVFYTDGVSGYWANLYSIQGLSGYSGYSGISGYSGYSGSGVSGYRG